MARVVPSIVEASPFSSWRSLEMRDIGWLEIVRLERCTEITWLRNLRFYKTEVLIASLSRTQSHSNSYDSY